MAQLGQIGPNDNGAIEPPMHTVHVLGRSRRCIAMQSTPNCGRKHEHAIICCRQKHVVRCHFFYDE